jgi:hypothetical protein
MKLESLVSEFNLKGESLSAAGADRGSTAHSFRAKPAPERRGADFDSTAALTGR